jgi:hypothetical protein
MSPVVQNVSYALDTLLAEGDRGLIFQLRVACI